VISSNAAERRKTPLNDRLFTVLREPLRGILPSDREYESTWDLFVQAERHPQDPLFAAEALGVEATELLPPMKEVTTRP